MTSDKPRRVLIVDDDELISQIAKRGLSRGGFDVLTVPSMDAALALTAEEKAQFGVLICDGTLSGLDLKALDDAFRACSPSLQVAVTSGYPLDHLTTLNLVVAPTNFIQKPWSLAEIIAFVRSLLDDDD